MNKENILVLYDTHKIKYEKCELYNDFILSLINLIFDTYLGDDITNQSEQKNHFKWCWDKNVENFKLENIYIDNPKLTKYFFDFMSLVFYGVQKTESEKINEDILRLWKHILDYNNNKSKSDVDTLIEVYKLFESGIKFR